MQQSQTPSRQLPTGRARRSSGRLSVRSGFTLLELLVVLAIVVLLAGLIAPPVVNLARENQVAGAAESVREILAQARVWALDAGVDYQFRYEPNGTHFVILPREQEPQDAGSTDADANTADYRRLAGELGEGFRLRAMEDDSETSESLDSSWFQSLDNALQLSQINWSSPVLFRFDGTAEDRTFRITSSHDLTADLQIRGLTGAVAVSQVYPEDD